MLYHFSNYSLLNKQETFSDRSFIDVIWSHYLRSDTSWNTSPPVKMLSLNTILHFGSCYIFLRLLININLKLIICGMFFLKPGPIYYLKKLVYLQRCRKILLVTLKYKIIKKINLLLQICYSSTDWMQLLIFNSLRMSQA